MKRQPIHFALALLSATALAFAGCETPEGNNNDGPTPDEVGEGDDNDDNGNNDDGNDDNVDDIVDEPTPCSYPAQYATNPTGNGQVIPPVSWNEAYMPLGEEKPFSFEAFHCDAAYADYTSVVIVQVTEWCPNCPTYVQYVGEIGQALDAAGMLVVFEVLDDQNPQDTVLSNSRSANQYINGYIGQTVGVRVGEADASQVYALGYMSDSVPFAMVVRKSDMKIIVSDNDYSILGYLDQIAADPDADWAAGPPSTCGDEDQESFEPNNSPDEAGMLQPGVDVAGGICGLDADAYLIDVAGNWQVDLLFDHETGDLDLYEVEVVGGQLEPVQGSESADDNESLTGSGPTMLWIQGYNGATATYVLKLTEM